TPSAPGSPPPSSHTCSPAQSTASPCRCSTGRTTPPATSSPAPQKTAVSRASWDIEGGGQEERACVCAHRRVCVCVFMSLYVCVQVCCCSCCGVSCSKCQ